MGPASSKVTAQESPVICCCHPQGSRTAADSRDMDMPCCSRAVRNQAVQQSLQPCHGSSMFARRQPAVLQQGLTRNMPLPPTGKA